VSDALAVRPLDVEPQRFEVFDLTVSLGPELVPWLSAASSVGHVNGIPRRGSDVPVLADLLDCVYDYVDAVRFAERDSNPELARALGQLVFGEPAVLELFQATRGVAADRGREILVRILAAPHMAVLPWELLPDPARTHSELEGRYLALAPDVSVVRLARGRSYPVRSCRIKPPLNLLVVLSSPIGHDPSDDSLAFDIYEEKSALLAELAPLEDAGLLHVEVEDKPTLENLRRRIGAQPRGYHLFHYLGHAEPGHLILEDEQGRRDDESGAHFAEIMRLCPDLRLAVFLGCETARPAGDPLAVDTASARGWRDILSLADHCVQESCPMVVGMQAVLAFRTERLFTRFFYQGLASGYSVAGAVRLARGATRGDRRVGGDLMDWSVPVLFLGGGEPGPLLDRSERGIRPPKPVRNVLRLGLRQSLTRCSGRDIALRQAVDVLSGSAPERVLVVQGPTGVGKTLLLDRVFEELEGLDDQGLDEDRRPLSLLYARFEDLVPELAPPRPVPAVDAPESPWSKPLANVPTDAPVERLCKWVAELLKRLDGQSRAPETGWTPHEWWLRLLDDATSRRFVIVLDNLDVLVRIEQDLTDALVRLWFAKCLNTLPAATRRRQVADDLIGLIEHLRKSGGLNLKPGYPHGVFLAGCSELAQWLGRWSDVARQRVILLAEQLLRAEAGGAPTAVGLTRRSSTPQDEQKLSQLRTDVGRLLRLTQSLDGALRVIADRRSGVRLAVAGTQLPDVLLKLPTDERFEMRLGRLTWFDTWRWIQRNLPGLLRYGESYLQSLWPRFGADLERWQELDRRVLESGARQTNMLALVDAIAPRHGGSRNPSMNLQPRGERPLRVAIAGSHIASAEALSRAITRLAAQHHIGGRVVADEREQAGSLAVLVEIPSPFSRRSSASKTRVLRFLQQAAKEEPDIVLLDYGDLVVRANGARLAHESTAERDILKALRRQVLLIAAGGNRRPGNDDAATVPAIYEEVLAVGSLDDHGRLRPYTEWNPELRKPDIFMPDQLIGTPFEEALAAKTLREAQKTARELGELGRATNGSSFAALNALGAAILVWSILPDDTPDEIRSLLTRAAKTIEDGAASRPKALALADAIALARQKRVRQELGRGPCSAQTMAALTGLELRVVSECLEQLSTGAEPEVRRLPRGRLQRYELANA
jgi:hypothetical protein